MWGQRWVLLIDYVRASKLDETAGPPEVEEPLHLDLVWSKALVRQAAGGLGLERVEAPRQLPLDLLDGRRALTFDVC